MKCPECNAEVNGKMRYCQQCGAPLPENKNKDKEKGGEPQLSRGMMIFIAVGLSLVVVLSVAQFILHHNDPDYVRTLIEPDSTLADRDELHFEAAQKVDTAAAAKAEEQEKKEAEKMFNSIRRQPKEEKAEEETSASGESAESAAEPKAEAPAAEAAPAPKVEAIETE